MKKLLLSILFLGIFSSKTISAQNITNAESLSPFVEKLKNNQSVTNILFLGDSHIQADWITSYLRQKFQEKYGNAGRGLVFPYAIANSNGPDDFTATSNQTWENFRLVYEQDLFPQMGASGFVIGNNKESFIEIKFKNPKDSFTKVIIFNDDAMQNSSFSIYKNVESLKNFTSKKIERVTYQIQQGDTFPELASKFYTTTTKLKILNGNAIQNPKPNTWIKTDKVSIVYNKDFENQNQLLHNGVFSTTKTLIELPEPQSTFLMKSDAPSGNIFYGFQFLNDKKKGVVFNTVGVNGATYQDFTKFPLQTQQLKTLMPDILIVALGTNESLSNISEEDFKTHLQKLVQEWRKDFPQLPILLISPTDNIIKPQKVKEISGWIETKTQKHHLAFFNLHQAMGGSGYFKKALQRKEANADGVHFLKSGYEAQAEKIWEQLIFLLK